MAVICGRETAAEINAPEPNERTVHCMPDVAECSAHSIMRFRETKRNVQSTSRHADATAEQQSVEKPRHWLKVPANNLAESEVVAKRKAQAKELKREEANTPVKIRGLMCPRMRALGHPAAPSLKEYASQGCPVDVDRDWTLEELDGGGGGS